MKAQPMTLSEGYALAALRNLSDVTRIKTLAGIIGERELDQVAEFARPILGDGASAEEVDAVMAVVRRVAGNPPCALGQLLLDTTSHIPGAHEAARVATAANVARRAEYIATVRQEVLDLYGSDPAGELEGDALKSWLAGDPLPAAHALKARYDRAGAEGYRRQITSIVNCPDPRPGVLLPYLAAMRDEARSLARNGAEDISALMSGIRAGANGGQFQLDVLKTVVAARFRNKVASSSTADVAAERA